MSYTIKDSGQREGFTTGCRRDTRAGKGRFDLIPPGPLFRLARHYEGGAKKYGDRNWEQGMPVMRCLDSAFRHLLQYMAGEEDEDHAAAVLFNLMAAMEYEKRIDQGLLPSELDDRRRRPALPAARDSELSEAEEDALNRAAVLAEGLPRVSEDELLEARRGPCPNP